MTRKQDSKSFTHKCLPLIVLLFIGVVSSYAQDSIKKTYYHEVGIGFTSTTSFNLHYQYGTDNLIYRAMVASLGGTNSDANTNYQWTGINSSTSAAATTPVVNTPVNINGSLNISAAKIKNINDKFGIMYGVEAGVILSYVKTQTDYSEIFAPTAGPSVQSQYSNYTNIVTTQSYEPFLGAVIGIRYKINSHFHVYAEVDPNINYTLGIARNYYSSGINTPVKSLKYTDTYGLSGLSNSGAMISIIYRIFK